jgi:hypothetical protein
VFTPREEDDRERNRHRNLVPAIRFCRCRKRKLNLCFAEQFADGRAPRVVVTDFSQQSSVMLDIQSG